MPRPRKPDGREPKSRSRNGCWSCKARKVKCTEERPSCSKCVKGGYQCDYGIRLNWDGRRSKRPQLKAIHLGETQLMDDVDAEHDDYLGPEEEDATATGAETMSPRRLPPPQSQLQMQFQLKPVTSPPSSSSSTFSVSMPPSVTQQPTSVMPTQMPSGLQPALSSSYTKSSTTPSDNSPFRVLTPMMAPSSSSTSSSKMKKHRMASKPGAPASSEANSNASVPRTRFQADTSLPPADLADMRRQPLKRPRIDSNDSERDFSWTWPMSPSTGSGSWSAASPRQLGFPPPSSAPVASEASPPHLNDDGQGQVSSHPGPNLLQLQTNGDFRRLSVTSLLSGPFEHTSAAGTPPPTSTLPITIVPQATDTSREMSGDHHGHDADGAKRNHHRSNLYYGIDGGFRDLDLGKNDDANALSGVRGGSKLGKHGASGSNAAYEKGGYYRKPVAVRIPHALGPLPTKLTENPMNLLYFHHFINNTARVLVPHDDPQSNPFRTILPQMAINNDNLLSLLLAYSASHRARILDQTEPVTRIALWVEDIFPALRKALDDHKQKISNANVATAIMLASLAIVSPTAFGYNIPWQRHLMLARELIAARPEGLRVDHHSSLEGQVCSFLWSWFAYIDVLGGLSGGPTDASPAWILDYKVYDPQDDDEIDCIMGFTTRCVYILSQIAELVRQCEPERLKVTRKDPDAWIPSMQVEMRVESLEVDVRDSMAQPPRPCAHLHRSGDAARWDRNEMAATNEAYHWAALVHLHRRVLGKPIDHPDVQGPVQNIIRCVDRVRLGGTAENCLLFPLFTAGCECLDEDQRKNMLNRTQSVEGTGMMQVTRARALMQRTWGTGKPWETLLTTEFIG